MPIYLPKLLIIIICLITLVLIAILVPPPKTWQEATNEQILMVFIPMLLIFTFIIDLFLKYIPRSFIVGLGLMFIVVLQAIGQLTIAIGLGILVAAILTARLYPNIPPPRFLKRLTLRTKIPKLSRLGPRSKK